MSDNGDTAELMTLRSAESPDDDANSAMAIKDVPLDEPDDPKTIALKEFLGASQRGDLAKVKDLIESGQVQPNDHLEDNVTALHWAAINNRLAVVKYLVSKGATVDFIGGELNATPLQWACRYGLVYIADYLLTECNADPFLQDSQGFNCLHLATHSSNVLMVTYLLVFSKVPVDSADPKGRTSLHWAAYQGDLLTVEVLLKNGASVQLVDETGFTPLHWSLIRGVKPIISQLIEYGSDVKKKNNEGKDCFAIAVDMNCTKKLTQALSENGRDAQGDPLRFTLPESVKNPLLFFMSYVIIPLNMWILSWSQGYQIPKLFLALGIVAAQNYLVSKYLIPGGASEWFKTPVMSGVLGATQFWVILTWLFVLSSTLWEAPFSNFLFFLLASANVYFLLRAMRADPGYIPPSVSREEIQQTIRDLMEIRKFDAEHFCIHTSVRLPLRSKYSKVKKRVVARFDHYCSWVNNDIGVNNHKVFLAFTYTLWLAIVVYHRLCMEYFDELHVDDDDCSLFSDELCKGFRGSPFLFNLLLWCGFQFAWLTLLVVVQTFQVAKGLTSEEAANLHRYGRENAHAYFESVPDEADNTKPAQPAERTRVTPSRILCIPAALVGSRFCRVLAIDQFLLTVRDIVTAQKFHTEFDFGLATNWLDFWFLREETSEPYSFRSLLKTSSKGDANLNGQPVNYYRLWNLPTSPLV